MSKAKKTGKVKLIGKKSASIVSKITKLSKNKKSLIQQFKATAKAKTRSVSITKKSPKSLFKASSKGLFSKAKIKTLLANFQATTNLPGGVDQKTPFQLEITKKSDRKLFKTLKDESFSKRKVSKVKKMNKPKPKPIETKEIRVPKLEPEGLLYSVSPKYDCSVLFIYCRTHDKVIVTKQEGVIFMPFVELLTTKCWDRTTQHGILLTILNLNPDEEFPQDLWDYSTSFYDYFQIIDVLRLQQAQTHKFLTRIIYQVSLKPEVYYHFKGKPYRFRCCGKLASHLEWVPMSTLLKGIAPKGLLGPELIMLTMKLQRSKANRISKKIQEFTLEDAKANAWRIEGKQSEKEKWDALNVSDKDIERLYGDYIDHCFPSFYMTADSFKWYMRKYSFENRDACLVRFFKAFTFRKQGFISFEEFIAGLFCMEPYAPHNQMRTRFVFRYYDHDCSGALDKAKIKRMLADVKKAADYDKEANDILYAVKHSINDRTKEPEINCHDFVTAVSKLEIRGTSGLCRASRPVFSTIFAIKNAIETIDVQETCGMIVEKKDFDVVCKTCKARKYSLSPFVTSVYLDSFVEWAEIEEYVHPKTQDPAHKYSMEYVFNHASAGNLALNLVRDFNAMRGTTDKPNGLLADKPDILYTVLCALYEDLQAQLSKELKLVRKQSPCFVLGDIHGNLQDLLCWEKQLWKNLPMVTTSFVFTGDYVDRGQWGFECALYLFAFKLLCPNKVTLLRGNHEVRNLQIHYTYKTECINKYGEEYGFKIWELSNRIFDRLPVAAVVEDSIYCAHGGIPKTAQTIEQIGLVAQEVKDPEEESDIIWEIIWSDPVPQAQFDDAVQLQGEEDEVVAMGYVRNMKRGTAYMWNERGTEGFLTRNGLSHIIRAHEVPVTGYTFHHGQKCVTIFSCSHYCGNNNEASCILIDNGRLRIIIMDTTNNVSATD